MSVPKNEIKRLIQLYNELNSRFVGRNQEIIAVLAGLISGEPTILVSPPGTAKTAMIEALAKAVGARYFYYLLTKFTEPDEILGPLDIEALRRGEYRRITKGRLPDAEIVFLDEIFKASSAIRNTLLDIMLNKRFLNGTKYEPLNMLALYTASNEVSRDAEDAAFYDRLLIRAFHGYVGDAELMDLLKAGIRLERDDGIEVLMTVNDVVTLQRHVIERLNTISESVMNAYATALMMLKDEGFLLSDRRKIKTLKVASAISVIYGNPGVGPEDVADALRYTAPMYPEDVPKLEELLMRTGLMGDTEMIKKLETLKTEAVNVLEMVNNKGVDNLTVADLKALKNLKAKIIAEIQSAVKRGNRRILPYVASLNDVVAKIDELLSKL